MPAGTPSLNPNPAAAIPGAALGLAQTVTSIINAEKAKKEAKELGRSRPKREISNLYGQNLSLAESELAGGMSQAAESAYNNQLDKSTSASLSAILRGGGSVNNVSDVFAGGEEGRQRLALLNDQLRLNQINNVVKARGMLAEEQDKNFLFNEVKPWEDKAAANAEARRSANEGIWSGLSTLTGGAMNFLSNRTPQSGFSGMTSQPVTNSAMQYAGRLGSNLPGMNIFNQTLPQPTPGFNPNVPNNSSNYNFLTNPSWLQG